MAHPMRSDVKDSINAKMRKMTRDYGSASGPANNKLAPTNREKGEGPESASGFGAEAGTPRPRADRASRISNPVPTYANGGAIARARGGRTKKGATNVNVIVAPQGGGDKPPMPMPPPMLAGPPPAAAMPPKPPMGAGPMGMPPGAAGLPAAPGAPGGMPPGLMPPRAAGGRVRAKGGRVHEDEAQDKALIEKTLKDEGLVRERAIGGRLPNQKHHMTAGAATGVGRLEKIGEKPKDAGRPQAV